MAQYSAVFTTYGTQQLAKAIANNKPLTATHFAVGDGNGNAVTVSANQERLVNEKYRATVSAVSLDPRNNKQVIFELTIPEEIGGFYIREMGVFDANNKLVAYANCPESFKPTLASGSGKVQVMRMILLVASSNAVTLTVDDSVIFVTRGQLTPKDITANSANGFDNIGHSHAIDKASTTKAGIVQLTNDTGLDSENLGLTAKAGKVLAQGIAALRLALNNYIPNNKKNSRVDSDSTDDVATPKAVKIAYEKGVEAKATADNAQSSANVAQRTANDANNNANTRLLKSELVGEVAFFARSNPPAGWLKANGAAVSRTTYAELFAAIGTTFGAGDGLTTFNLPDLRGEFIRGVDDGRNVDSGRGLGTAQGDAIKTHTINVPNSGYEGNVLGSWFYAERGNGNNNQPENKITYNGENETRPRNVALLACIKY